MTDLHFFYLMTFLFFFYSVVLHEVAHGGVAYLLGDKTAYEEGRLTLNPLSHIDPFNSILMPFLSYHLFGLFFGGAKPIPVVKANFTIKRKDLGDFLVTIAGPLTNLILAFVFAFSLRFVSEDSNWGIILSFSLLIQVLLFCFNMIPLPPLDGGHIFKLFLPGKARKFVEKYLFPIGLPLLLILIVLAIKFGYWGYMQDVLDKVEALITSAVGTADKLQEIRGYWNAKESLGF